MRQRQSLISILRAQRSVSDTLAWLIPGFRPTPWQYELGNVCDRIVTCTESGEPDRITLSAPPRHGKTQYVGIGTPVCAMLRAWVASRPLSVVYATSTDDRARDVSQAVKRAILEAYRLTDDRFFAPGDKWTTTEWVTQGGLAWYGVGWRGSTGGIGGGLAILDDMIGSSQVYRSEADRARIRDVVQEDILSRLEGGPAVQMETRRGPRDTTAWLTETYPDVWRAYSWACHAPERGYLWPDRYGETWHAANPHLTDSSPIWRALYQQEPIASGGQYIAPAWLDRRYAVPPMDLRAGCDRVVCGADLSVTGSTTSDHTAIVVLGRMAGRWHVLHVVRRQMGWIEQRAALEAVYADWRPDTILVELAANGHAIVEELERTIPVIRGQSPAGRDKVARLTPWLGTIASGIAMPERAAWLPAFIDELLAFDGSNGGTDDQVDALVWALEAGKDRIEAPLFGDLLSML